MFNKKNKKLLNIKFVLSDIFILSSVIIMVIAGIFYINEKRDQDNKIVFVESNATKEQILETLEKEGVIKDKISYLILKGVLALSQNIEPGGYDFSNGFSALAIHSALTNPVYKYIAIEPGLRKEQVFEKVSEKINLEEGQIERLKENYPLCSFVVKEGFLAPGEYLVPTEISIQEFQKNMRERFEEVYLDLEKRYSGNNFDELFSKEQIVTIASLIQREAAGKNDMRLISGIIWNRISKGMPLQIDATLQYAKGEDGEWWPVPKSEDKFIDSEYNTYQIDGLPPGPIANPSKDALAAAMNPLKTSCVFYLHDRSRNIHCSSTYDGHLANIKRYLK